MSVGEFLTDKMAETLQVLIVQLNIVVSGSLKKIEKMVE
jgi:hypothetical protein